MKAVIVCAVAAAILGAVAPAFAQQGTSPAPLSTFKQWSVYTSNEADGKMCFIVSQPTNSKYSKPIKKRDPAFFMITTIPARKIAHEASTIIGYTFKDGSKVTIDVDGTQFTMFTDKENAWVQDPKEEPRLIDAMKSGHNMTVQGTSRPGTQTTDSYSLSGVSAALDAMNKACPQ